MGVICSNATRGSFFKVVSKIARGRQWRKREKEAVVIIKDILKRLIPGLISKFFSPGCREGKGISPGGKKTPSAGTTADVGRSGSRNVGSRRISRNGESLCCALETRWRGRRRRPARPDTRGSSSCLQRTRMKKHDGKRAKGRGS